MNAKVAFPAVVPADPGGRHVADGLPGYRGNDIAKIRQSPIDCDAPSLAPPPNPRNLPPGSSLPLTGINAQAAAISYRPFLTLNDLEQQRGQAAAVGTG
jgi:hypothetical protein